MDDLKELVTEEEFKRLGPNAQRAYQDAEEDGSRKLHNFKGLSENKKDLQAKLSRSQERVSELERNLQERGDIDPEEFSRLKAENKKLQEIENDGGELAQRIEARLQEKYAGQIAKLEDEKGALSKKLRLTRRESLHDYAVRRANIRPERRDAFSHLLATGYELEEGQGGELIPVPYEINNETNKRQGRLNGDGKLMNFDQYIDALAEEYKDWQDGTRNSGMNSGLPSGSDISDVDLSKINRYSPGEIAKARDVHGDQMVDDAIARANAQHKEAALERVAKLQRRR